MRTEIAVSEQTVQFCYTVREGVWQELQQQLTPDQIELVRCFEGLHLYASIAQGTMQAGEAGRRDAPHSLMDALADALRLLPRERWPDQAWLYADQVPLAFEALQVIGARLGSDADG